MYKFNNLNIEWGNKTSENIPMTKWGEAGRDPKSYTI